MSITKNKKSISRRRITKKKINKKNKSKSGHISSSRLTTKQIINNLIDNGKLKEPHKLRVGYVSRDINGSRYIVKQDKNKKKYYTIANKAEIECHKKLQENMSKFIAMYKSGHSPFKSIKGAMSFAIKETEKSFPKCTTSKAKYNRSRENRTYIKAITDYLNYYRKYFYYKFLNF